MGFKITDKTEVKRMGLFDTAKEAYDYEQELKSKNTKAHISYSAGMVLTGRYETVRLTNPK